MLSSGVSAKVSNLKSTAWSFPLSPSVVVNAGNLSKAMDAASHDITLDCVTRNENVLDSFHHGKIRTDEDSLVNIGLLIEVDGK